MDNKTILDYVLNSPENTNPAILNQMLDELKSSSTDNYTVKIVRNWTGEPFLGDGWIMETQAPIGESIKLPSEELINNILGDTPFGVGFTTSLDPDAEVEYNFGQEITPTSDLILYVLDPRG